MPSPFLIRCQSQNAASNPPYTSTYVSSLLCSPYSMLTTPLILHFSYVYSLPSLLQPGPQASSPLALLLLSEIRQWPRGPILNSLCHVSPSPGPQPPFPYPSQHHELTTQHLPQPNTLVPIMPPLMLSFSSWPIPPHPTLLFTGGEINRERRSSPPAKECRAPRICQARVKRALPPYIPTLIPYSPPPQ
ncbi:hypothetical protein HNY73_019705 [Argiope bruennichi]|uniref:Uncharacterized protein n=1 Tax=Argiope bruennichi TaxID=94029 RepID=A0A8T0E864_ARGBR|nr:hypothetical protein HNY73_019705 [Argiope bruennichi]